MYETDNYYWHLISKFEMKLYASSREHVHVYSTYHLIIPLRSPALKHDIARNKQYPELAK